MDSEFLAWFNMNFMSHGHCYLWRPDLVLLHVLSDSMIALAYYSIPFALWKLKRNRPDLQHGWILTLFAVFIFACGTTHVVNIWNIWHGHYYFSGAVKFLTAIASLLTAILIWPLIPKLIALPSPSELQQANQQFQEEIARRIRTEDRLLQTQLELETKFEELSKAREKLVDEMDQRKSLEQLLEKQNADLRRSNNDLEHFASIAAHDLREPLRKIKSFTQLLSTGKYGHFNEQGTRFIGSIESASGRMHELLESLLNYSRLSSQDVVSSELDLCSLISDVQKDLQLTIEETGATVSCDASPGLMGDPTLIRQLMQNLLSNSLKYRKEEISPIIEVRGFQQDSDFYTVTISDNGIGFNMEHGDKIFELFHRLHGRSEYSGAGVGLAVCKKIVNQHRGDISVQSTPGKGTTFTITLPVSTGQFGSQ